MRRGTRLRAFGPALLGTVLIACLTLVPFAGAKPGAGALCLFCGERAAADAVLNVLLYLPLGVGLALAGWNPPRAALLSLLLSGAIETAQIVIPGRDPSARDVLTNALGCYLGTVLVMHVPRWLAGGPGALRRLVIGASIPLVVVGLTGWLLTPAVSDANFFGHWRPRFGQYRPWSGEIASASIGQLPIRSGRLSHSEAVRRALATSQPLVIDARAGTSRPPIGTIFAIIDTRGRWQLLIAQQGADLLVRPERRASRIGFEIPMLRLPGALELIAPDDPVRMEFLGLATPAPCVEVNGARRCARPFGPGSAWILLKWSPRWTPGWRRVLDSITLLVLTLPLALLIGTVERRQALAVLLATLIALVAISHEAGLSAPNFTEWLAIFGALLTGRLTGPRWRRAGPGVQPRVEFGQT